MAVSDTGQVRTRRIRTAYALAGVGVVVAATVGLASLSVKYISGNSVGLIERLSSLQNERDFQDKQLSVFAQELGTIQARLDRFDAIGEKLFSDEVLGEHLGDEAGFTAQGGVHDHDHEYDEPQSVEELKDKLGKLNGRVSDVDEMMRASLHLLSSTQISRAGQPHVWPVMHEKAWLSSNYGYRTDPFKKTKKWHSGVDIAAAWNAPIVSAGDGVVMFAGYRYAYGTMVEVLHADGVITRYGHMKKTVAKNGQHVQAGDIIGLMGSSGRSTGPHLHFEVLVGDVKVNPTQFIIEDRGRMRRLAKEKGQEMAAIGGQAKIR